MEKSICDINILKFGGEKWREKTKCVMKLQQLVGIYISMRNRPLDRILSSKTFLSEQEKWRKE